MSKLFGQRTKTSKRALDQYERRPDKDWSLTDCLSFLLMEERGITEALTADHHFEQAGFRALLAPVKHNKLEKTATIPGIAGTP